MIVSHRAALYESAIMKSSTTATHLMDEARDAALARYVIVDTPPDAEFDEISARAAHYFDVAIAGISFWCEQGHWFKSSYGIDAALLSRATSTLPLTAFDDGVPRFDNKALIIGDIEICFCATAPIIDSDGHRLGLIWLLGEKPRALPDEKDMAYLNILAAMVVREIEFRKELNLRNGQDEALRESENRFRQAFQNSPHGMAIVSLSGAFLKVNPALCAILDYSETELLALDFQDITDPQDLDGDLNLLDELLNGEIPDYHMEKRYIRKDGSTIWALLSVSLVRGDDQKPRYFISQITNIQRSRDDEAQLADLMERHRLAVEGGGVGIWEWRSDADQHYCDLQTRRHFQIDAETPIFTVDEVLERIHPDDRAATWQAFQGALIAAQAFDIETRVPLASGGIRHVHLRAKIIRDETHRAVRMVGTSIDVTELRTLAQRLETAKNDAERASDAKSLFYANMGHEIRTPLNASLGLLYLLERTTLDTDQTALVRKINLANRSLLAVVNSVLDSSKLELGSVEIEALPFNLFDLVQDIAALAEAHAAGRDLAIEVDCADNVPPFLIGDAVRIHQILLNLVNNAVKFTESGEVRVEVRRLKPTDETETIRFSVVDTGIGINEAQLANLFRPFVQADSSTTRRFGGTGLGLAIARELVILMGGQINARSTQGEGSEFWFDVTFKTCKPEDLILPVSSGRRKEGARLKNIRILIVDDSEINLEVGRNILAFEGAIVESALSGQIAVDAILAEPKRFDLVLMDLQMPLLDGYDAFRRITAVLGDQRPRVLALTAGASANRKAELAAMDGLVIKPFDVDALVIAIHRALNRGKASEPNVQAVVPTQNAEWPLFDGVDWDEAKERMAGNRALFLNLLKRVFDEFGTPSPVGGKRIESPTVETLHKLKSNAGLLGMNHVSQLAELTESAMKTEDSGRTAVLIEELSNAFSKISNEFENYIARID